MIKANILTLAKIYTSKKDFICYNLDRQSNITDYILTNDLTRHRKGYTNFKLVDIIKQELNNINIL